MVPFMARWHYHGCMCDPDGLQQLQGVCPS
jgi:hypothetical protein